MSSGIVLFAHGSRDPRWAEPFEAIALRLRVLRPDALVRVAYLEIMTPTLHGVGEELVVAGCASVEVLPLFLGTGGHLRRDLPLLLDALRARHPGVRWTLHPPAGEAAAVIDAIALAATGLLPPTP
jgi:sirohydrochlorin cobaltochelatase